jgi:quinol monooxygenase YgiN
VFACTRITSRRAPHERSRDVVLAEGGDEIERRAVRLGRRRRGASGGGREGRGGSAVRERNDANAFVLSVELEFKTQAAADALVKAWGDAADWCRVNEPTLLHYEIARSNKDESPLRYSIFERYRSLEDYLGLHKNTVAFKTFRPKMQAMQDAGEVVVAGQSYYELGKGFVSG